MVKFKNTTKGFTALFAVLVSSLILSVGIGIINITLKEIALSAAGRESQFAFYAADSGAECAQYWDNKGAFTVPASGNTEDAVGQTISCFGDNTIQTTLLAGGDTNANDGETFATTTFAFNYTNIGDNNLCGFVYVGKYVSAQDGERTIIVSEGRNSCGASSVRQVERGLVIQY